MLVVEDRKPYLWGPISFCSDEILGAQRSVRVLDSKPRGLPRGGGGGGTLIFSHIRRLGPFFFGFKILNFNIFWGFEKNEHFLGGIKILWIYFWGHHKIGLV